MGKAALIDAVRRGVRVEIVLSKGFNDDTARDGVSPVTGNGIYASHAKYTSVDSAIAVVGTANMDTQSWNNSREVNVLVDDADLTTAWDDQMFVPDFARGIPVDACRR